MTFLEGQKPKPGVLNLIENYVDVLVAGSTPTFSFFFLGKISTN